MGLFIPTSGMPRPTYSDRPLTRGALVNMDTAEQLFFQFNPETFSWQRETDWREIRFIGGDSSLDLQFINIGAKEFELDLLFLADPGAPRIEYLPGKRSTFDIPELSGGELNFEFVKGRLESWESPLPEIRRPSRIKVIVGKQVIDSVITRSEIQITEFFPDLTAREAQVSLEMRVWRQAI